MSNPTDELLQKAAEKHCTDTYVRSQDGLSPFNMAVRDFKAGAAWGIAFERERIFRILKSAGEFDCYGSEVVEYIEERSK